MMEDLSSSKGTFNVHLNGGSPWGFTLHGGSEFNTKLYIKRLTPGGKAFNSQSLQVGDEVLCINDIACTTRAKAIENVKRTGQSLQLTIKRASNDTSGTKPNTRQNGVQDQPSKQFQTGLEEGQQNDFYSTYSVDPVVYAKIVKETQDRTKKMSSSYDSGLSASNEDLLNTYRTRGAGSEDELDNIEKPVFSNGRISPNRDLRMPSQNRQLIHALHSRAKSWSEHRGHSFPENQLHGRTFTSPGRIQKVKITSANISSSSSTFSSPDDEGSRQYSRISPVKHSPIARQHQVNNTEKTMDHDHWFERWLRDDKSHATTEKDISVKDACSKYEQEEQQQDTSESQAHNRSNFSRSKSFSGRPSYGVVFGTTAVKSDDQRSEITAYQAPLPSTRYNSADLLREKARQNIPVESWKHVEVETSPRKVTTIQEERRYTDRLNRKSLGAFPLVSSTSSLDSFSDAPRQGPAIPPRRSESKLLRSMRRGKSSHTGIGSSTTRQALKDGSKAKHSVSNSWPSDYLGSTVPQGNNRQSWSPEETRVESDPSNSRAAARRSSSVVIKSVRTSSTSSEPKIYRSSSMEMQLDSTATKASKPDYKARPQSAQARVYPSTKEESRYNQKQSQQQQHKLLSQQQQQQRQQQQQPKQRELEQPPQNQRHQPQHLQRTHEQHLQDQRKHRPQQQGEQQHAEHQQRQQQVSQPRFSTEQQLHQQHPERQQQQQLFQKETDSFSSRIEDTQILQKLIKDTQVVSVPQSVRSRVQKIEKSSSQPNLLDGPDVSEPKPGNQHHKQRSWDNSYAAFNKTFSNARSELRATGRFGSTERLLDSTENRELEQDMPSNVVQQPISPVKVTSRQIASSTVSVMQPPAVVEEQPQKVYDPIEKPINERILRTESSSIQEKEVYLEEVFKTLEEKETPVNDQNERPSRNLTIKTQSERNVKLSVGDDDVFTNPSLDDSLPPPPSPSYSYTETSYENLPLPTPPRELLIGEPILTGFKQDQNRNEICTPEQSNNNRHSFTENRLKFEENRGVINKPDNNEVSRGFGERKHNEVTMNDKNSTNDEQIYKRRTENYIYTEYRSEPSPKERVFNESATPSKSELDSAESFHRKQSPSPIVMTSTPTRSESDGERASPDSGDTNSPFSGSNLSTPSSSRPGSMMSPKLEQLDKEKCELVDSMKNKIQDLRTQMNEITDEINENEKLGEKVTVLVEDKASPSEFSKYQRFTGELNKIVLLLLSLTQRMHRYENTLQELDMAEEGDRQQRDVLLDKIDHVKSQYEEACKIKEVNDKRGEVVSRFLENYLDEDEFADFQYYIDMKTQLALMHAEIKDKVKMGEERLNTLSATSIDWNVSSFCGY